MSTMLDTVLDTAMTGLLGFIISSLLVSVLGIILGSLGVYYGLVHGSSSNKTLHNAGIAAAVGLACCFVPYLNFPASIIAIVAGSIVLKNKKT